MADEYDPLDPPTFNAADESDGADSDMAEEDHAAVGLDEEDYDPDSFISNGDREPPTSTDAQASALTVDSGKEFQPASRNGSTQPNTAEQAPRTKIAAGFIVEESDEEDAAAGVPPPSQLDGADGAHSESKAEDILQAQDVSLGSAPTQDTASAVPSAQQTVSLNGSAAASAPVPASPPSVVPSAPVHSIPSQPTLATQPDSTEPAKVPTPTVNGTSTSDKTHHAGATAPQAPVTQRLPHDKVGQLEDRIKDEPRADSSAWMSLIAYYREKEQLDNVRKTYERFVTVFPTAASAWLDYLNLEQDQDDHVRIDTLLSRALMQVPNVELWQFYLNVLRRRHPLLNDTEGRNRAVISQAFDLVLDRVGLDPDAGGLWREYIDFVKSGPGSTTSTGWQDMQKIDFLRKAYQKAVTIPNDDLTKMWKEYDHFELSLNRGSGRKFLNERSPHYMTAKAAKTQLDEKLYGLDRMSLPRLPPLFGCEGDVEFGNQVQKWRGWIEWEKNDELVLKQDGDVDGWRKRVVFVYKQAVMSLRFYPEVWFEAASWCFEQGAEDWKKEGEQFLDQGISANPESALLALRKADRVETGFKGNADSNEVAIQNGEKLDLVYEKVHKALYELKDKYLERENKAVAALQEHLSTLPSEEEPEQPAREDDDDEDEDRPRNAKSRAEQMKDQIQLVKTTLDAQREVLKRTISYIWVAKLRAFRRIQGQGAPGKPKKGFRGVFAESRPRGSLTSDVYVASALMEHHCYNDAAATKIFERGLKLFPNDELFVLEYIKHLVSKNDLTNAKAVFETTITRIEKSDAFSKDQQREKCRPLLGFMHHFESNYGDLAAIHKLEKRMADMYPNEPELLRFSHRFEMPSFDGMRVQLVISPLQARPRTAFGAIVAEPPQPLVASIEEPKGSPQTGQILLGPHGPYVASPKRPLDDSDSGTPSRKFMRGESPIKGAAGRRIATTAGATVISGGGGGSGGFMTKSYVPGTTQQVAQPEPLPRDINYILSILPPASNYRATTFDPMKMVELLRNVNFGR